MKAVSILETIKAIDKLISLYGEVCDQKFVVLDNSNSSTDPDILDSRAGICSNICIILRTFEHNTYLPTEFFNAAENWAMKFSPTVLAGNAFNKDYWLDGKDEYYESEYYLMTNPLRLHAMIYIRNYLTQFVGQ